MLCNSWVIIENATGKAVMETYNSKVANAVNTAKYRALTAHEYLVLLNERIKNANS